MKVGSGEKIYGPSMASKLIFLRFMFTPLKMGLIIPISQVCGKNQRDNVEKVIHNSKVSLTCSLLVCPGRDTVERSAAPPVAPSPLCCP